MKKALLLIALSLVLTLFVSCATKSGTVSDGDKTRVISSIFTKEEGQSYVEKDGEMDYLDTMWIYYTDGTFEQFVEHDDTVILFSKGAYSLTGGDFVYEDGEKDFGDITIKREMKYVGGKLTSYSSVHTYDLGSLGFDQLYVLDDESKTVEAVFFGEEQQLFIEMDGDKEYLDTVWIYYSDMTFEQYASFGDKMILFSIGTYYFEDNGNFINCVDEKGHGDIVIKRTMKYSALDGLAPYSSSHAYDLSALDYVMITYHVN